MNVADLFKREIFKPFVTLLIPGTFTIIPYVLVIISSHPKLLDFWSNNAGSSLTILLLIAVAVGLILEDIGSWVEASVLDEKIKKDKPNYMEEWHAYLQLAYDKEPIGQQYLDTILLRLKFELSFGLAIPIFLGGLIWCKIVTDFCSWTSFIIITLISLILCVYLFFESYDSAKNLSNVRSLLIKRESNQTTHSNA
jgi:hypothetical protein